MSGRKSWTLCGRKDKKSGGALEVHLHFVSCSGRTGLFLTVGFHPLTSINEGFHPRSDLVFFFAVKRIVCVFPWEASTFQVRHHGQMTAVLAGNTGYAVV